MGWKRAEERTEEHRLCRKGTQKWKSNGAIYDGDWQYGKRNGFGTYSLPDPVSGEYRKVYSGEWKNGKRHGLGINFYSDDDVYEGHWYSGKRDGWGRMYYVDCSTYEGEWSNDLPNGQGMLRLANENRYEGVWKNGKKHGSGKFFFFEKGQLYDGVWIDDVPKCGKLIDFGRENAIHPTLYPMPQIKLRNPAAVLKEARSKFLDNNEEDTSQHFISSTISRQWSDL
ncbi:MORN repeat-containing protein 3 isoform X2 [Narcine bancroftii]|uniref:MORN repeat-containing protein 3 isoform X2 n=1 Tax=Narcine bancroftii TaxID=1343680 RepID=UPI0038320D56